MNKILHGDCLIKLKELPDNLVDSIITDPPYELGFYIKIAEARIKTIVIQTKENQQE